MAQGQMLHHAGHRRTLGAVLLHELHPGGGVVEEIPDADGGALRAAGRLRLAGLAALQMERRAHLRTGGAGKDIHTADGGDGGQIGGGTELAGGMAQKGGRQLLRRNAAAVVGDADVGQAAVLDLRHDGGGSRVDGVLQQFFDDAGGTLHHLAGGDKIRHMGR